MNKEIKTKLPLLSKIVNDKTKKEQGAIREQKLAEEKAKEREKINKKEQEFLLNSPVVDLLKMVGTAIAENELSKSDPMLGVASTGKEFDFHPVLRLEWNESMRETGTWEYPDKKYSYDQINIGVAWEGDKIKKYIVNPERKHYESGGEADIEDFEKLTALVDRAVTSPIHQDSIGFSKFIETFKRG